MDVQDFWSEISVIQRHFKATRSKSLCTLLNSTVGVKNICLCFALGFVPLSLYLSERNCVLQHLPRTVQPRTTLPSLPASPRLTLAPVALRQETRLL